MIECPNHEGNFDCTPFCPLCEGEQEYQQGSLVDVYDMLEATFMQEMRVRF
jgi:hypothetical protein